MEGRMDKNNYCVFTDIFFEFLSIEKDLRFKFMNSFGQIKCGKRFYRFRNNRGQMLLINSVSL